MGMLAQQSAEESLKALLYARGYRRILTHSVYELIREIGEYEPSFLTLKSKAKALDAACITTRYPDRIAGNLTPSEYYDREDAEECIEHADSICRRERSARRVMEQVQVLAREIRARRRVSAIILYGSFSRGDFHEERDVDPIVVGDFPERPHKRATFIIGLTDLPVEPLCYTDEEFAGLIREENPFILQALAEGTRV
ncbi:MAG TPA: HEPN domain-containing protein [Methanoculleus sp.]|nr:HEPN domain-containing protein [Methanoculleus sp.]